MMLIRRGGAPHGQTNALYHGAVPAGRNPAEGRSGCPVPALIFCSSGRLCCNEGLQSAC